MVNLEPIDRDLMLRELRELLGAPIREETQLDGTIVMVAGNPGSEPASREDVFRCLARYYDQELRCFPALILGLHETEPRSGWLERQRRPRHRNPRLREPASFRTRRRGTASSGCSCRLRLTPLQ